MNRRSDLGYGEPIRETSEGSVVLLSNSIPPVQFQLLLAGIFLPTGI
ncbi:MAG: hypothetical protein ACOYUK_03850 [Patescibacteria group bacterium]